eukprot:gnl/Spiro4/24885_TR12369_c0_g1_i1.p1 gnl/Spiro4/24885_TR12369_c0_g1~~gnl/Spiro4/24885_TR12369_c0_g1_i1.p1  ORF type:complete len:102 (+),score=29.29 gnl/Spiro4/24885_TR12369_c0_g1_i1:37-306(+)
MKALLFFALFLAVAFATNCEDVKDPSACRTTMQPGETQNCVWCICAAVPSTCVTVEQAKKLPPSVFKCDPTNTTMTAPAGVAGVPVSTA